MASPDMGLADSAKAETVDFVSALKEKYSDYANIHSRECAILVSAPRRTSESEDQDTSSTVHVPPLVSLNDSDISAAGDLTQLGSQTAVVTELDVAKNQFSDWTQVYRLMSAFPNTEVVNLSYNPLHGDCDSEPPLCARLKRLVLNGTRVQYSMVDRLLRACPGLEELHLSLNYYQTVDLDLTESHDSLTVLYFNSNSVTGWNQIAKFGRKFPNLTNLTISESRIKELGTESSEDIFPKLRTLCLSQSDLESFDEMEKLNSFPCLNEVRLKDIPAIKDYDEKLARQLLLAHLPRIVRLNASRVCEREREDAERAAIRHYMQQDQQPQRYDILVAKHGKLDPLVEVDLQPENQVTVKVTYKERQTLMEIDTRWTIKQVKTRISDWVKIPASKFRLFYIDPQLKCGPTHCIYPNRVLHTMYVTDGCEFQVHP